MQQRDGLLKMEERKEKWSPEFWRMQKRNGLIRLGDSKNKESRPEFG
jgi:hypothetical protein